MDVKTVYINTHKYDFHFARICIASIRYWYPDVDIALIKDENGGSFSTEVTEENWHVRVLNTERKRFGWGYGKLEPLFLEDKSDFLILDSDTVLVGPVLDTVKDIPADFIVDEEVQPAERFNEIYYNLNRIHEVDPGFVYPGYSFNSGQWFGSSAILSRNDFEKTMEWSDPPTTKFPEIIFYGDQTQLNFVLHKTEQEGRAAIARIPLMVWPDSGGADFINLDHIRAKKPEYPHVIHWAGMKSRQLDELPRADILNFYKDYFYSRLGDWRNGLHDFGAGWLNYEKRIKTFIKTKKKLFER